jgi:hypothetical protein
LENQGVAVLCGFVAHVAQHLIDRASVGPKQLAKAARQSATRRDKKRNKISLILHLLSSAVRHPLSILFFLFFSFLESMQVDPQHRWSSFVATSSPLSQTMLSSSPPSLRSLSSDPSSAAPPSSSSPLASRRRTAYKAMVSSRNSNEHGGGSAVGSGMRERFLARCADRLRQERSRAVDRTRRGLPRADGEQHRLAEEEELLRRMAKREWERYKRSLESELDSDMIEEEENDGESEGGYHFFCMVSSTNDGGRTGEAHTCVTWSVQSRRRIGCMRTRSYCPALSSISIRPTSLISGLPMHMHRKMRWMSTWLPTIRRPATHDSNSGRAFSTCSDTRRVPRVLVDQATVWMRWRSV